MLRKINSSNNIDSFTANGNSITITPPNAKTFTLSVHFYFYVFYLMLVFLAHVHFLSSETISQISKRSTFNSLQIRIKTLVFTFMPFDIFVMVTVDRPTAYAKSFSVFNPYVHIRPPNMFANNISLSYCKI